MQLTSLHAENLPVPTVSKNNKLQTNRKINNLIIVPPPILTTAIEEKKLSTACKIYAKHCKICALFKCQYIYKHKTLYWGCCSYIIHSLTTGGTGLPFPHYVRFRIEIPLPFLFLGTPEQHTSCFSNKLINKSHLDAKKRLKQWQQWCQQERQKSNRFRLANQRLLYISLPSLHDCSYDMKIAITFRGWGEQSTQRLSFFFPELWYSLSEFNLEKNFPTFNELNKME